MPTTIPTSIDERVSKLLLRNKALSWGVSRSAKAVARTIKSLMVGPTTRRHFACFLQPRPCEVGFGHIDGYRHVEMRYFRVYFARHVQRSRVENGWRSESFRLISPYAVRAIGSDADSTVGVSTGGSVDAPICFGVGCGRKDLQPWTDMACCTWPGGLSVILLRSSDSKDRYFFRALAVEQQVTQRLVSFPRQPST